MPSRMHRAYRISVRLICLLLLPAGAAICGCRSDEPADPGDAPAGPVVDVESLTRQAESAWDRREFLTAADLYDQLARTLDGDHAAGISRQAALSWWLAGRADTARDRLTAAGGSDYSRALADAMDCYRAAGWPVDRPDRMLDVLMMAPAIQACAAADSQPVATQPETFAVQTEWAHLSRLAELLAGFAALDAGHLAVSRFQLVTLLVIDSSAGSPPAGLSDADRRGLGLVYRHAGRLLVHPAPATGQWSESHREWISRLGERKGLWPPADGSASAGRWRLIVAVRRGDLLADWWQISPADETVRGDSKSLRVVLDRPRGQPARRLLAGLNLLLSARGDGSCVLGSRSQAERVARAAGLLSGKPAEPVESGGRWWVVPKAAASGSTDGGAIPLIAAWLEYRGWPENATLTATTGPEPDDWIPPPLEP